MGVAGQPLVVKIGGSMAEDRKALTELAAALAELAKSGEHVVLVHGGGRDISRNLGWLNQEPHFVDGLRVTDAAAMDMVEMTLSGRVNKMLVRLLQAAGSRAVGISGIDGGLLSCRPQREDGSLGFVGAIRSVDVSLLEALWKGGFLPVVSPVSLGADGNSWNVNADQAAAGIAGSLKAAALLLISDVSGVLCEGKVISRITASGVEDLISDGTASGGMIPKLRSAANTVRDGVGAVHISGWTGRDGLRRILDGQSGTCIAAA